MTKTAQAHKNAFPSKKAVTYQSYATAFFHKETSENDWLTYTFSLTT